MMMASVNFVVLKINNIDVGELPQQQQKTALSMLLNEETDNIVLELKRKSCWTSNKDIDYDDIEISKKLCYLQIHHNTPFMDNTEDNNSSSTLSSDIIVNLHLPNSTLQQYCIAKSTQTEDIAFYVHEHLRNIQKDTERLIEHEHNLFEQSLAPEIDIEEITLRKSDSNERLGITVCYSNAEEYAEGGSGGNAGGEIYNETVLTEVYISDIHPDSVAGRDGRLRQGDQILQINGKDIKTRPETETLIAENNNAVTLLVSRYLYADEDDFNDPSTNEDEDEVLVVEDDEDDDDEDDEFYEENNMTYVNCVINNDCCINDTEELDKALMSQVVQQEQLQQTVEKPKDKFNTNTTTTTSTIHSNPAYQSGTLKCTTDVQKDKTSKSERKSWLTGSSSNKCGKQTKSNLTKSETCSGVKPHDDYETEHIYETIPEDPESEPFYCSPYDSSVYVTAVTSCSSSTITDALQHLQQKQRVAQWLGIKPLQDICATTAPRQSVRSSCGGGRSSAFFNKSVTGTVRSAVTTFTNGSVDCLVTNIAIPGNSQLEDQDNSSSAYNTGGSNNSVSPLTLMLNPKNRTDQNHTINPTANGIVDDGLALQQIHQKTSAQQKNHSPKDKSKITSPKGGTFQHKTNAATHKMPVMDIQMSGNALDKTITINKETNVHRNMLLKQHLFNQKLSLEKSLQPYPLQQRTQCYYQQQPDQIQCPQFTAPNLSQYHFVSSKEVNNLSLNNKMPKSSTTVAATISNNPKKEEETMVWKVKRRPDGTRYIVRRPAKTRVIKERNTRLNVERLRNDITTTEDDTISEIKTGRYWTREERKKHIEKARERRQQQQQLFQQQQSKSHLAYDDSTTATLCIGDVTNKILQDTTEREKIKQQQYQHFIRQQQKATHQQQQHYQLQFNSAEDHKHSASLHNMESPTKKSSTTLPATSEEFSAVKANMDQTDVINSIVFTSSEHNQINNSLQSVTTT